MKKLTTLVFILFSVAGFSQSSGDVYAFLVHGKIKQEKLAGAKEAFDIIPNYPKAYFAKLIDYVSVEISAVCDGKKVNAVAPNEVLSPEQKNILNTADLGSDIYVSLKFSYKDPANDVYGTGGRIKEMKAMGVMVIPDHEAQFPGGNFKVTDYLKEKVLEQVRDTGAARKFMNASVSFMVDEEGKIRDVKLSRSSLDAKIDQLIIEAANTMPEWIPAQNAEGIKVKQVFSLPVRRNGC